MSLKIGKFFYKQLLLFVIFITGAVILVLEVVGVRFLSIYFGSTIYTVSSVISVILLALSLGYFTGGRLADKKASEFLFYSIILVSGFSVLLIYIMNLFFIPNISYSLSLRSGPLIISFLLFFLPSFLLGTLSPVVAALQNKRNREGIGRTVGDVYFWSTFGSIFGSLVSGFVLIPFYGIDRIILDAGVLLTVIAILGMLGLKKNNISRIFLIMLFIFIAGACVIFTILPALINKTKYIFLKDGVYERITVYNGLYRDEPVRYLKQDDDRSNAVFPNSSELVYNYTKYYAIYKLFNLHIKKALVIGAGAYSVPKALLKDNPDVQMDVVDIEPALYPIVKRYFGIPDDVHLKTYANDGRRFLHDNDIKFDYMFSDAFSFSTPFYLTTKEFFQLSRDRLTTNGIFIMNIVGDLKQAPPSFALSEIRTFQKVYPNSYFFAAESPFSSMMQNIILVGVNSGEKLNFATIEGSQDAFLSTIRANFIDLRGYDLYKYNIFTDNYAPVEYYASKILNGY